jgi:formate/nitrite transporter
MDSDYTPSLTPKEASTAISKLGIKKANTKIWQLIILGMLAGLYIGFGSQLFLVTLASGLGKVMGGLVFSVGLILVVVAGAELFTGNVVILIGVISSVIKLTDMVKNWIAVYIGNFIGAVLFAILMYYSGLFGNTGALNAVGEIAVKVAEGKLAIPFTEAFIRGIFCNMLVILAILMAVISKDIISKIFCIIFPITCFVACGFEHCVANMYLIPIGLFLKGASFPEMLNIFHNLIPVTLGNIVGGVFILVIHPNRIRQISMLLKKHK